MVGCGHARAQVRAGVLEVESGPDPWDGVRAAARAAWAAADAGMGIEIDEAVATLTRALG